MDKSPYSQTHTIIASERSARANKQTPLTFGLCHVGVDTSKPERIYNKEIEIKLLHRIPSPSFAGGMHSYFMNHISNGMVKVLL